MSATQKTGNPAVVGLAAFGLTTILLQMHNLGLCGKGPVLAAALVFGGLCQMIAGFQEQKVGNNFGYSAFVSYGAFWIGLGIMWLMNAGGPEVFRSSFTDVGWMLVAWTGYTAVMWVASWRVHGAMAWTFTLLLVGFVLLVIGHFGPRMFDTVAAYELIVTALMAWYMMAAAIVNDLAGRAVIPLGRPWIARRGDPAALIGSASASNPGERAAGHKAA